MVGRKTWLGRSLNRGQTAKKMPKGIFFDALRAFKGKRSCLLRFAPMHTTDIFFINTQKGVFYEKYHLIFWRKKL